MSNNYTSTIKYHPESLFALIHILCEELLCVPAATVISATSGNARCHRVHLFEPLLLFIFRRELMQLRWSSIPQPDE